MTTAGATIDTPIAGSGGLSIGGPGVLTYTANALNTYTGTTTINGFVSIVQDSNLGASTAGLQMGGGTLKFNAASISLATARTVTLPANTFGIFDTSANSGTIAGQVTGGGQLVKTGANTLTLTNLA